MRPSSDMARPFAPGRSGRDRSGKGIRWISPGPLGSLVSNPSSRPVLASIDDLTDLSHDSLGKGPVALGIDLGDISLGMTQDDLCGLESVPLTDLRCERVTESVRTPDGNAGLETPTTDRTSISILVVPEARRSLRFLLPGPGAGRWRHRRFAVLAPFRVAGLEELEWTEQRGIGIRSQPWLEDLLSPGTQRDLSVLPHTGGLMPVRPVDPQILAPVNLPHGHDDHLAGSHPSEPLYFDHSSDRRG